MIAMEMPELLRFASGEEWRDWLECHHKTATEAWLVHYKKSIKKPGVSYSEALDEALCFGWIDTKLKSLDKESFMLRWVPRQPGSVWSKQNKDRAEELTRQGRMTWAGLASMKKRVKAATGIRPTPCSRAGTRRRTSRKPWRKIRRLWRNSRPGPTRTAISTFTG